MTNHAFIPTLISGIEAYDGGIRLAQATPGLLRLHDFEQDNWAFNLGGSFPEWQAATGFTPSERLAAAAKFGSAGLGCVQGTTVYSRYLVGDVTARPTTYTVRAWLRWKFNSSTSQFEMFHGWLGNLFSLYFSVDRRYAYCRYGSTVVQLDMGESVADTWICFDFVHEVQNNQTRVFRDNAYQGTLTWPVAGAFLGDLNPLGFGLQNNGAAGSYTYLDDLQVYNYDLSSGGATTPVQSAGISATQFSTVTDIETETISGNLTLDKSSLSLIARRRVSSGVNTTFGEWEDIADSDTRVQVAYKDSLTSWSSYMTLAAFKAIADSETAGFELRIKLTPAQADEQIYLSTPVADYTPSATPTSSPDFSVTDTGAGIDATVSGSDSGTNNTLYGKRDSDATFSALGSRSEDGVISVTSLASGLWWLYVLSFGPNGTAISKILRYAKTTSADYFGPEEALRQLLVDDADIASIIEDRVIPLAQAQGGELPCLIYTRTDSEHINHTTGYSEISNLTFDLDVFTLTYKEARALSHYVQTALNGKKTTVVGSDGALTITTYVTDESDVFERPVDGKETGIYGSTITISLWFKPGVAEGD